ncbi:MAG: type VI secretion system protein TssA [Pseudomonadota bacterium]|nr:type VI secretion system protein TssA [Pseudomonadota bacterium]
MTRNEEHDIEHADRYFRATVGHGWDALLAPVSADAPAGVPAAQDESYRRIRHEREEEDATLPLGPWERELKRANWVAASELTAAALAGRSKDLQLAAWLFESLIARSGFEAVAPCLRLVDALLLRYAHNLHPHDSEHRLNLLLWIGQKLLPPLRRVMITATGSGHDYAWSDWEQAQRNEQLRASLGKQRESEIEGAMLADVGAALACTPDARIVFLRGHLCDGLAALQTLERTLDAQIGDDAPGLSSMRNLLESIDVVLAADARRRGVTMPASMATHAAGPVHEDGIHDDRIHDNGTHDRGVEADDAVLGSIDRREVYAALADIARALETIEPHSPVPYLVRRAVAWGGLNTAQLYSEVFVRCGGQINIFELLGLDDPANAHEGPAAS